MSSSKPRSTFLIAALLWGIFSGGPKLTVASPEDTYQRTEGRVIVTFQDPKAASTRTLTALELKKNHLSHRAPKDLYSVEPLSQAGQVRHFLVKSPYLTQRQLMVDLSTEPGVLFVEPDQIVRICPHSIVGSRVLRQSGTAWYSDTEDFQILGGPNLQALYAEHPVTGAPVVIFNIDSGSDLTDPNTQGHVSPILGAGENWTGDSSVPDGDIQDPGIVYGNNNGVPIFLSHGHTVEAQEQKCSDNDPNISIYAERVLLPTPGQAAVFTGQLSWILRALESVKTKIAANPGIRAVVNLSLVLSPSPTLRDLIAEIPAPIFVAAGNGVNDLGNGVDLFQNPDANALGAYAAQLPNATPVGALTFTADAIASFSEFGVIVRLFAPGIVETLAIGGAQLITAGGTSFSTPTCSAIAAELLARGGETDAHATIERMIAATPVTNLSAQGQPQAVQAIRLDTPLQSDPVLPPLDSLQILGKVKYRTLSRKLTFQVNLVLGGAVTGHDFLLVPGFDATGPGTWLGAFDLGTGGTFSYSVKGDDPGFHPVFTTKGGGIASPSPKVKHPPT